MMICKYCKNRIPTDSNFCNFCGKPTGLSNINKDFTKTFLRTFILIVVLIAILTLFYYPFVINKENKNTEKILDTNNSIFSENTKDEISPTETSVLKEFLKRVENGEENISTSDIIKSKKPQENYFDKIKKRRNELQQLVKEKNPNFYETKREETLYPLPDHNTIKHNYDHSPNFTIKTDGDGSYYYLKIVNDYTGEVVQTVFVHSGKTASVHVPNGTYKVRWTSGEKWYGYDDYFGNNSAQEANETFTFTDTSGWEITLYPVYNGNLSTSSIDLEEF